jgi:hypothetical protein
MSAMQLVPTKASNHELSSVGVGKRVVVLMMQDMVEAVQLGAPGKSQSFR